jgi:hypothetical protein
MIRANSDSWNWALAIAFAALYFVLGAYCLDAYAHGARVFNLVLGIVLTGGGVYMLKQMYSKIAGNRRESK